MTFVRLCVALILVFAPSFYQPAPAQKRSASKTAAKATWSCPMHPDVVRTKPGKCPKCGMSLRRVTVAEKTVEKPKDADSSSFSSVKIPHARVLDQNGKQLDFYDDLIKGKSVAINFIFTTCTTICPPLTATFRKVQQEALARGLNVQLISISVDPTVDTPERLQEFAKKFKAESGWTFVTGDKGEIDSLLQAFGVAVTNKNDHTPMILIGNEPTGQWTRTYGLSSPAKIADLIAEATIRK